MFENKVRIVMLKGEKGETGDAGDYSGLTNKPSINNVTLDGNINTNDLGVASQTAVEAVENAVDELNESVDASIGELDAKIDAKIVASTTDLEDGSSALESGILYCVYE